METIEKDLPAVPAVAEQPAITPMQLMSMAVSQGADTEKLKQLMDLQLRWEANEARKAYNVAFAAFKSEAIQVVRRVDITDGPLKGKKYADLAAAVDAATPFLSKHGLSSSWKITKNENDWIEVSSMLTHVAGHYEEVAFGGPPDTGGAKNPMQARASTLNYLERYTFLAVCGLAAKGADDDGRGGEHKMTDAAKNEFLAAVNAITEQEALEQLWKRAAAACQQCGDIPAYEEIKRAVLLKKKSLKEPANVL